MLFKAFEGFGGRFRLIRVFDGFFGAFEAFWGFCGELGLFRARGCWGVGLGFIGVWSGRVLGVVFSFSAC